MIIYLRNLVWTQVLFLDNNRNSFDLQIIAGLSLLIFKEMIVLNLFILSLENLFPKVCCTLLYSL